MYLACRSIACSLMVMHVMMLHPIQHDCVVVDHGSGESVMVVVPALTGDVAGGHVDGQQDEEEGGEHVDWAGDGRRTGASWNIKNTWKNMLRYFHYCCNTAKGSKCRRDSVTIHTVQEEHH